MVRDTHMANIHSSKGIGLPVTIAILALVLVVAGVAYYAIQKRAQEAKGLHEKTMMGQKEGETMMQKGEDSMTKKEGGDTMMEKGAGAMVKYAGTVLAGTSAPLIDFNTADYDAAVKSDKLVVLYFYANWCPICKQETIDALYPAFNALITDKVVGFRVNYNDSETDTDERNLAREFGVAYQHTKVFLKNGQRILKSPEGWDQNRYLTEISTLIGT